MEKHSIQDTLLRWIAKLSFGSEKYAVRVEAEGRRLGNQSREGISLQGKNESFMTTQIAVAVASFLYDGTVPKGIYHIDELF